MVMLRILFERITLRHLPSGRFAYALSLMWLIANRLHAPEVIKNAIAAARTQAQETLDTELRWTHSRTMTSNARGNAVLTDSKIDELIAGIAKILEGKAVGRKDDPEVIAARKLLSKLLASGVGAVTQQPHEVQLGLVDAMLARMKNDLAPEIQLLGLQRQTAYLEELTDQLRIDLQGREKRPLTFETVLASRNALYASMRKVIATMIYTLDDGIPENEELLSALMEPIEEQESRVADAYRRRRRPLDVDPSTGEEVPPLIGDEDEDELTGFESAEFDVAPH